MPELPSQRQFLTDLIKNLTAIPPSKHSQDEAPHLPPSSRNLLLTLHVLFPTLLLPALDLLDRRLVTYLAVHDEIMEENEERRELLAETYVVKSLATTITRRHRESAPAAPKKRYIVSLGAWNCSCASFAFDAFPANAEGTSAVGSRPEPSGDDEAWEFGGMSLDGQLGMGEDVPCCKHLLACLLADQWGEQIGSYVETREVCKEEFAGAVAGL